jgi:outer membrane protein OmpA-like peptidoglycan-associated protein
VHATLEQLRIILQHRLEAEITLNEKVAAITSEQQNLQAQVAELSAELDTATASLEQERQQIATDQKQTHELTAERDQLRDDLANRDKQLATLQAELQTTAQALQQTESETTISRQKLSDATAQAEELKNKRTVLQGQLEDRQTALRDAERSLADVIAERDSLQADLAARSEELAQAQAALTTAESEQSLADVIAERDGLQADLVTRSEELTRAQAALTTAQSEIDALRQAQVETAGVVAVPTTTPATNEEIEVTAVEIAALQTTGLDTDGDGVPDSTDLCSATQQNVTVDGTGCADGVVINLEGVNFRYDSHELTGEAQHILDRIADILTQQPELRLEVAGHTDAQGDPAYNQWLSLKRAEAVRDYIVAQGVNPNHIGAGGYGGQRPVADNSTKEGLRMNRRVELRRLQ